MLYRQKKDTYIKNYDLKTECFSAPTFPSHIGMRIGKMQIMD